MVKSLHYKYFGNGDEKKFWEIRLITEEKTAPDSVPMNIEKREKKKYIPIL